MILQLEDCVDVLKIKFDGTYDYLFYFDHSGGHTKSRPDRLDESNMNKGFGGKQNHLHDSVILLFTMKDI